jgi:ADP-ribose pyrophosphatase YjhB (NUDIX family)
MYGIGAGGHVEAGEDISAAASRELREETSLSAPVEYICTENFETPGDAWTAHLFVVDSNDSIDTDESEWQWSGWVDKVGVDQLYREGKLCMDTGVLYQKYLESTLKK